MRKNMKILAILGLAFCSLGAGRAYYSSVEGLLSPGILRAYPAVIEEIYSDGTVTVRMSVWSGVETLGSGLQGLYPRILADSQAY
jgi:hypothetical protein